MKIIVAKDEVRKLRRRMSRAYPRERIEYVYGKFVGDVVQIHVFDAVKHQATRHWCEVDEEEHAVSVEHMENCGLKLIGSVHSHPDFAEASPSEGDYDDCIQTGELVMGIVGIWHDPKREKMRTVVRFYGPLVSVDLVLT